MILIFACFNSFFFVVKPISTIRYFYERVEPFFVKMRLPHNSNWSKLNSTSEDGTSGAFGSKKFDLK